MNQHLTAEQLRELSVAERLRLIEDVWQSLEEAADSIEVPDWHRSELDTRLAASERGQQAKPWPDAKAELLDALGK